MDVALRDTEDYEVESPDGALGRVEEVWLGPAGDPRAVAVRLRDGRHALLLDDDVVSIDREHRWVVVGEHPELQELDSPRLETANGKLTASWSTTGGIVRPAHPEPPALHLPHLHPSERALWQQVALLYAGLTVIVIAVLGLVFGISWAAGGAPY